METVVSDLKAAAFGWKDQGKP